MKNSGEKKIKQRKGKNIKPEEITCRTGCTEISPSPVFMTAKDRKVAEKMVLKVIERERVILEVHGRKIKP